MKFSYNWLQTYFAEPLPAPAELAEKITFHSSEIEELVSLPKDMVLDVKVLPDKSPWLMSHRGLAKEISVILDKPLLNDLFKETVQPKNSTKISVTRTAAACDFYAAALLEGVKVGPTPTWLRDSLEVIGQRSINNIVDATNYVMFELGQPLHAFDADKLTRSSDGRYAIEIRNAQAGEEITTLTNEKLTLLETDTVITDGTTRQPIGIAGVKGGQLAAVEEGTVNILIESAHFDRVAVRNTSKRLRLQTDAAKRYENGISVAVAPIAFNRVIDLIIEVAGGVCTAETFSGDYGVTIPVVNCSLEKINSVLGLKMSENEVSEILNRFGYQYEWVNGVVTVTPPFERDDIVIPEDLVEEIGRVYGLDKIVTIAPVPVIVKEFNIRHYYAEKIRTALTELGFSEIYTSSFRNKDIVKLENALASDKEYLRSTLTTNLREACERNIPHRDLLGLTAVKLFEIGTVFGVESEEFRVALVLQTGTSFKEKVDGPLLKEVMEALSSVLGLSPELIYCVDGMIEFSLDGILTKLPPPIEYEKVVKILENQYQPFSMYPAMSRDIAMWVPEVVLEDDILVTLQSSAGTQCVRITHLDTFTKENRTSYAFRLVFQSKEKTLTDVEVQEYMEAVYKSVRNKGWEVR